MSRDTEILDTIDAVAGHQRTGNGRETIGHLTAELREYFQTPEAESLPVDTQVEDDVAEIPTVDDVLEVAGAILEQEHLDDTSIFNN